MSRWMYFWTISTLGKRSAHLTWFCNKCLVHVWVPVLVKVLLLWQNIRKKSNLSKEDSFWLMAWRYSPSSKEGMVAGAEFSGHIAATIRKQREPHAGGLFLVSVFIRSWTPVHGIVSPTFRGLLTSSNLIQKLPHRHQSFVTFQVHISINHHSAKAWANHLPLSGSCATGLDNSLNKNKRP